MAIETGMKYLVDITNAVVIKSSTGKLGLNLLLTCPEGQISETLWFSEAAKERSAEKLLTIGVNKQELKKVEFWRFPMEFLKGKNCSIVTESESYTDKNGTAKTKVRVKYINSANFVKPAPPEAHSELAALFADDPFSSDGFSDAPSDEEVPFG
jgi:hypothetical protein